jgi:hypothetical protein
MKKLVSVALMLTMVLAMAIPAFGAATPVSGDPAWDAKYADAEKLTPIESPTRNSADGDKIPSNAHSADFPGLYFYWNDKQKEDGVLLVLPEVFALFEDGEFTLTAKNASTYWEYAITPDEDFEIDGVYAYGIPRNFMYYDKKGKLTNEELKNINMVFIDGNYKDAKFNIVKKWYDEEGAKITDAEEIAKLEDQLKFNNDYILGLNIVKITDYKSAWFGKKITITETAPAGYIEKCGKASQPLTVKHDDDPIQTVTFKNQKQFAYIDIVKVWLDLDGEVIDDEDILADLEATFEIEGEDGVVDAVVGPNQVKAGTYKVTETGSVKGYTLASDNEIVITVAAGETVPVTFYNQAGGIGRVFGLFIEKHVDGELISEWAPSTEYDMADFITMMSFDLYKLIDEETEDWEWIIDGTLMNGGTIAFGFDIDFSAGDYKIVETLQNGGEDIFKEVPPYYFTIDEDEMEDEELFEGIFENFTKQPSGNPIVIKSDISSRQHYDLWWNNFGILAVGGSGGSDNDYFIAFGEDFWDKYESATIGFGTKGSQTLVVFTYEGGTLYCDNPDDYPDFVLLKDQVNGPTVYFEKHHHTTKDTIFNIKVGASFTNPFGAGAMQIWLMEIQPK